MLTVDALRACKMKTVLHMDGPRDRKSGWWADIANREELLILCPFCGMPEPGPLPCRYCGEPDMPDDD